MGVKKGMGAHWVLEEKVDQSPLFPSTILPSLPLHAASQTVYHSASKPSEPVIQDEGIP